MIGKSRVGTAMITIFRNKGVRGVSENIVKLSARADSKLTVL